MFKPITKWADRVHHPKRIPELIHLAVTQAMTGRTGPTYLDLPGDILYQEVDESTVEYPDAFDYAKRAASGANADEVQGHRRADGEGEAAGAGHRLGRAMVRGR